MITLHSGLTPSHDRRGRIHTIMDSDKVLVLDRGRVVEFAPPDELMQAPDGVFRLLAEAATAVNSSLDAPVPSADCSAAMQQPSTAEAKPA